MIMEESLTTSLPVTSLATAHLQPKAGPRRRRNPLACNECRQRKSRCDGQRPTCSSCLQVPLQCKYQEPPALQGNSKRRAEDGTTLHLHRRIRVLETMLRAKSGVSSTDNMTDECVAQLVQVDATAETANRSATSHTTQVSSDTVLEAHIDRNIVEEEAVDFLATATFGGEEPQINIGCFGPSSNHAFFRTLSGVFAHTTRICSPVEQHSMIRWAKTHYTRVQTRASSPFELETSIGLDNEKSSVEILALPNEQYAIQLIDHFFATISLVLPYLDKSTLMSEYNQARKQNFRHARRDSLALLNIVWAYASGSLRAPDAETFYRRALALLDERTLRGTSPKLVQVLLLIGSFQQNNQRSVASWTPHALAVKAALQLGLHSPDSYKDLAPQESELRKRLWYGVVNDDRSLSISLGRPCLIPSQHVRVEKPLDPHSTSRTSIMVSPDLTDSFVYYNHVITLCAIAGSTVERLYNHNIGSVSEDSLHDLISKRLQLAWQLKEWRQSLPLTFSIIPASELTNMGSALLQATRFRVLLSIRYYRILLLIDCPLLTAFLNLVTKACKNEIDFDFLLEALTPVVKNDLIAANELRDIIHAVTLNAETFLDRSAAWFMCNYAIFTVSLHLFGILLGFKLHDTLLPMSSITYIRTSLDQSLETMRILQRTSLMSHKARRCLLGLLEVFDSFTSDQQPTPPVPMMMERPPATSMGLSSFPLDIMADNYVSQYIASSTNDFLSQGTNDDFLHTGCDFLYPYNNGSMG